MSVSTGYATWFTEDAAAFLDRAGEHLSRSPLTATVLTTVAQRVAATQAQGEEARRTAYDWFAVVTDADGGIAGTAMRTAPFAPYPPYLLAMPDGAALALAHALLDRGEEVGGAAGELPAADVFAAEIARATGREVRRDLHMRLFRLGELVEPPQPPGRLRRARPDEVGLALEWYRDFHVAADEQAGRDSGHGARSEGFTIEEMSGRIADGRVWFWVDGADRPLHVTGCNSPAYGVARIGPVYTPEEHRGNGYASAAVAGVSRALLEEGAEVVALFTDQANPTSNYIYPALGYVPVTDTVELLIS